MSHSLRTKINITGFNHKVTAAPQL